MDRENSSDELKEQEYLEKKLQPVISEMVQQLLVEKPENPAPNMIRILDNIGN
jgi:hypothetical protein